MDRFGTEVAKHLLREIRTNTRLAAQGIYNRCLLLKFGYEFLQFFEINLGRLSWVIQNREAYVFLGGTGSRRNFNVKIRWPLIAYSGTAPGSSRNGPVDAKVQV
jgi:hypothetical protein